MPEKDRTERIFRLAEFFLRDAENPRWNVEAARKGSAAGWNYVDGCMILAFLELYRVTEEKKYLDFSDAFMDRFVAEDGRITTFCREEQRLDDVNGAKALLSLYELTGRKKYRLAADRVWDFLRKFPRTEEGSFIHKKVYPGQVWLDGLYMALPFYMEYETKYDHMRNCFDVCDQFLNARSRMRDPATGLYYHGYDESRRAAWADPSSGCSRSFWLRAVGWLVMALVDTLEKMDEQIYYEYRMLEAMLKDLIDSLLRFEGPDGMFYQVIDRGGEEGNYPETSGTCMVACGILKAVRLRLLPERYRGFGERIFRGAEGRCFTVRNGGPVLGGICLVCGLGGEEGRDGSAAYYYRAPVVENDGKGVAPFLLAFAELLRAEGDAS